MRFSKHTFFSGITSTALSIFLLSACGGDSTSTPPPPPPAATNSAPSVTSPATATTEERSTASFYTATATDANNDSITFSITGGADAAFFTINSTTGELSFIEAADFENPLDNDADNIYELTIAANDGTASTSLGLSVTVTDVTNVPVQVTRVTLGLDRPIFATGAGDNSGRLFIVEQRGQIRILNLADNALLATPFLDITPTLSTGNEQGLLGLAFAPDYTTSGLFYVYTTNLNGDTEVLEYSVSASDPNIADPASRRLILTFAQPFNNHNAGWMDFGPDGFLYITSGDGGGAGDPQNNAQNTGNLLGAVLRIDPFNDDFPADVNANYAIPADNPFVGSAGADEIWAYGLRNPFRASFDRATGDLYMGDVGQGDLEEIDLIPLGDSGLNFGWNILEGTQTFTGGNTVGLTPPVAEYPHDNSPVGGFSVTGGYVHRGSVEALFGQYVFADFASGNVWSLPVSDITQGDTIPASDFTIQTETLTSPDVGAIVNISSFAEDDNGELYIVEIFRGEVFRIENDE